MSTNRADLALPACGGRGVATAPPRTLSPEGNGKAEACA
jgi:hypothetical protein